MGSYGTFLPGTMEDRSWWLVVWFPVRKAVSFPLADVCQLHVSLVNCTTVLWQTARSPGPEVLKLSLWKAEGKQNRSESRFNFLDCSLTGMVLWFSAFKKKIVVPICFIDINYCKSDSFSAYWFLPKVKFLTFNRKHKWFFKSRQY